MHAARLVEYSDSEEDEEQEWREYHRQRSILRIPKSVAPPAVATPASNPQPTTESPKATTPERDFAYTPRKRSGFFRSASSPSPYSRKSSSPIPPLFPFANFSYSPNVSASPMSDTEPKADTSTGSKEEQSAQAGNRSEGSSGGSMPTGTSQQRPATFTFGSYDATEASKSASPFSFSGQKSASTVNEATVQSSFTFGSGKSSIFAPSPQFAFSPAKAPSFDSLGKSMSADNILAGSKTRRSGSIGKTPQRQKDLHRAAKRRVSVGSTRGSLSGFGGLPASTIHSQPSSSPFAPPTTSPVDEAAKSGRTPRKASLSPMDIEMDDSSTAPATSSPAFQFGSTATAAKSGGFSFKSSTGKVCEDHDVLDGLRGLQTATGKEPFRFGATLPVNPEPKSTVFPRSDRSSDVDSSTPGDASNSKNTSSSGLFRFGIPVSATAASSLRTDDAQACVGSKSNSFSFEAAFKEYAAPSSQGNQARFNFPDGTNSFSIGREKPAGRESLEARLARRRLAREGKSGADRHASTRSGTAQKSLFQTFNETTRNVTGKGVPFVQIPTVNGTHKSNFEFKGWSFNQGEPNNFADKVTTNVFQKRSANSRGHVNSNSPGNTSFPKASHPSSNGAHLGQGGIFSFNGKQEPEPSPPPHVENLKSNFDGFSIGVAPKSKKKASRTLGSSLDRARSSQRNKDEPKVWSFKMSDIGDSASAGSSSTSRGFASIPPADPFVTPLFGLKKNNSHQDHPISSSTGSVFSSPSTPNSSAFQQTTPLFGSGGTIFASTSPKTTPQPKADTTQNTSAPPTSSSFFGGSGAPFLPDRRILKAARPNQHTPDESAADAQSAEIRVSDTNGTGASEETHRGWSEWKGLGGSAYTKKAYQEAADCYLNSIVVLEGLLSDRPELKTDQLMKDKAKLHSNRAAALMMLMQLTDAQRECHLSIESDPSYTRAYLRLGRIQVMLGDSDGAKESATTAKHLLSLDDPRRKSDTTDIAGIKKIESAVDKLERLRGEIQWCLDVHDFSQALNCLHEALAVAPSCRKLQTQKASVLFEQKNYAEVVEYCVGVIKKQKAIERNSRSNPNQSQPKQDSDDNEVAMLGIDLSMLRIRALHCENKIEDAMRQMQKLELAAPCSAKVIQLKRLLHDMRELKHRANELFKKGDYAQAQEVYSQALQLDASNDEYCAVIYCNRAAALMGLEQFENAIHDCNAALRRKARYPRCLLRRARCNVALKRYPAAIADFDRYLVEHQSDSSGEIKLEKERAQQALEAQEQKRKEEQQRKERQKNSGRAKSQSQQQRRSGTRQAWDDSKFYEDFWRSSSSAGGGRHQSSSGKSSNSSASAQAKHRRSHYDVLGITKSATQDEIKKAYRKLALLHHPDKAKGSDHADVFKDMTAAYNVLSDTGAREKYDRELQYGGYGRYYEY